MTDWYWIFPAAFFAVVASGLVGLRVTTGKWLPDDPEDGGM